MDDLKLKQKTAKDTIQNIFDDIAASRMPKQHAIVFLRSVMEEQRLRIAELEAAVREAVSAIAYRNYCDGTPEEDDILLTSLKAVLADKPSTKGL